MRYKKFLFSRTKSEVIFVNFFDKFAFATIIVTSSICIFIDFTISIKTIIFILVLVVPFIVLFNSYFKRIAYKLVFDIKKGTIELYMFRNMGVTIKKIKEIEKVENRGYITFYFKGGDKILWKKRPHEEELINLLKRITVVQ